MCLKRSLDDDHMGLWIRDEQKVRPYERDTETGWRSYNCRKGIVTLSTRFFFQERRDVWGGPCLREREILRSRMKRQSKEEEGRRKRLMRHNIWEEIVFRFIRLPLSSHLWSLLQVSLVSRIRPVHPKYLLWHLISFPLFWRVPSNFRTRLFLRFISLKPVQD